MAVTKPKTTKEEVKEIKEDTAQTPQVTLDLATELAKKDQEIAEMKNMMLQMQQMMMMNQSQSKPQINDEYVSIYKSIPVISLFDGMLNLGTLQHGQGKLTTFHKFGEVRKIPYEDLRDIVGNNFSFAQQGLFYIMDEQVVREVGLEDAYQTVITKDQIEGVINNDKNAILDILVKTSPLQKEVIVDTIVRKMADGEDFDLNKIDAISSNIGYDIREMVKDLKFARTETGKPM